MEDSNINSVEEELDVLISCMNIDDINTFLKRTRLNSSAVVINQISSQEKEAEYVTLLNEKYSIKVINSFTRGLSVSRNIALKSSNAKICLLCDDDEVFSENYRTNILDAFFQHPNYDVIAFSLNYGSKKFGNKKAKVNRFNCLKINSVQIAFRRDRIIDKGIQFDEKMGSGTGNGAGEENKFLMNCLESGLKILYIPVIIASVNNSSASVWNNGFDEAYFFNRGWSIKRILGFYGFLYIFYFSLRKYKIYKKQMGFLKSISLQLKGYFSEK